MTLDEINKLPLPERKQALKKHREDIIQSQCSKVHTSNPVTCIPKEVASAG